MPRKSLIEEFLDAGAGLLDELFGEEDASSVAARSRNAGISGACEVGADAAESSAVMTEMRREKDG